MFPLRAVVGNLPTIEEMEMVYRMRLYIDTVLANKEFESISSENVEMLERIIEKMEIHNEKEENFFHCEVDFYGVLYGFMNMKHM